MRWLKYNKLAN